jgi:integrase
MFMPLEPYRRGATWWARGKVEYNGRPITGYLRESTGASDERGARDWIIDREEEERRRHFLGEAERPLTFQDAVMLYTPTKDMGKYLIPVLAELGPIEVAKITPQMIKNLGPKLYPNNSTDSWRRWVITPARAVINNANDLGKCPPIRIKGFEKEDRIRQDRKRGKRSRVKKTPGSFEWLLKFRQHAGPYRAALALFMFATGARVGQSTAMHPDHLAKLDECKVTIPGAKGHDDREVTVAPEVAEELRRLKPKVPRGWDRRYRANLRVFGFASKDGPRKGWLTACKLAGIPYLPPHSAGRHGFGQEMRVRRGIDKKAVGDFGGWSDTELLDRTYTHGEDSEGKILGGFRTGLVQAENLTGLKLLKELTE